MVTSLTSSDPNILFDLILDLFENLRIYEGKLEIVKILIKLSFILFLYFMLLLGLLILIFEHFFISCNMNADI